MGLGFLYINPPVLAPIVPGRGVVGHYVDRCIISNRVLHDRVDFRQIGGVALGEGGVERTKRTTLGSATVMVIKNRIGHIF